MQMIGNEKAEMLRPRLQLTFIMQYLLWITTDKMYKIQKRPKISLYVNFKIGSESLLRRRIKTNL